MKKLTFVFCLTAALSAASCKQETPPVTEPEGYTFVFSSDKDAIATRTAWNGETIVWSAGDKIRMAYTVDGLWQGAAGNDNTPKFYTSNALNAGGETAEFTIPTTFKGTTQGTHKFYTGFPSESWGLNFQTASTSSGKVQVTIPTSQTPEFAADGTTLSFDRRSDIMIGESARTYSERPAAAIPLVWNRLVAHGNITLKNLQATSGETVRSVQLSAQSGAQLTGSYYVDLLNGDITAITNGASNSITLSGDNLSLDSENNLELFFSILPVTLTELSVTVITEKPDGTPITYTRTVSGISKTFRKNARNTLTVNMQNASRTGDEPDAEYYEKVTEAPDDWSGEYLIVYEDGPYAFYGALSSLDAASNYITVTISGDKVEATDATRAARFTIAASGNGYSIQAASGKYIGQGSNANGLTASDTPLVNSLSLSGGEAAIVSSGGAYLRFNKSSGQTRFRYFKSSTYTNQQAVQLYRLGSSPTSGGDTFQAQLETVAASGVTSTSATLNAQYSGVSTVQAPTEAVFYVGTSTRSMQPVGNISVSGKSGTYSWSLTELSPGIKYYFYASMSVWNPETNQYQTIKGETLEFTTARAGQVSSSLDWAELPVLDYSHVTTGGYNYYTDNNDNTLYYTHHWTDVTTTGGHSLRNYTSCWSSAYKCPVWVAAALHECYSGNSGRTNAYKKNPDLLPGIQYSGTSAGNSSYNRGHMLASNQRTLSTLTNNQVFYTTNIAPQANYMNGQGTGWNKLEDYVMGEGGSGGFNCSDTLYVVIGNYFDAFTDGYGRSASPSTETYMSTSGVHIPTMLYVVALRTKKGNTGKSVKDCSADELQCAAFCRTQNSGNNGQAVTKKEMMSVSDLEKITGLTYFANVPNAPKGSYNPSDWGLN